VAYIFSKTIDGIQVRHQQFPPGSTKATIRKRRITKSPTTEFDDLMDLFGRGITILYCAKDSFQIC
jgi:hypothetical protein